MGIRKKVMTRTIFFFLIRNKRSKSLVQERASRGERVLSVLGRVSDESVLGRVSDESVLGRVSDESVLGRVSDESVLGRVSDESVLGRVSDESVLGRVSDESVRGRVSDESVRGRVSDESVLGRVSDDVMTSWTSKSGCQLPRLQNGNVINECPKNAIEERKLRLRLSQLEIQRTKSFSKISGEQHFMKLLSRKLKQPPVRDNSDVKLDYSTVVPGFVFSSNGDYKCKSSKQLKNSSPVLRLASSVRIERRLSNVSVETHRAQSAPAVLKLKEITPHHLLAMETLDNSKCDVDTDNQVDVDLMEHMRTLYLHTKKCSQKTEGVKPTQHSKTTRRLCPGRTKITQYVPDTNDAIKDIDHVLKSRSSKANCVACEARLVEKAKELQKYREDSAWTTEINHNKHGRGRTKSDPQLTVDLKVKTPRRSLGGHPTVKLSADHGSGGWRKTMHRTAVAAHAMRKEFESKRQRLKIEEFFSQLEGKPVRKTKTTDSFNQPAEVAITNASRRSPEDTCECRYLRMPVKRVDVI
uniref:Uncharacterized protein LOC102808974 n=1 Tax=Saccoglossus kowalevskii TaxID=10224 RepID=A0ABM0MMA0_SACKO|nr:PREDICTED: uncharacterized protein LOC102808974 [Saccoglossus kowalevskii]